MIEAQGKDKRGNGTAGATSRPTSSRERPGTKVVVHTELKITGRPAQFGRGVIQDVGGKMLDQFADCLSTRLGGEAVGAPGSAAPVREARAAEGGLQEADASATAEPAVPEAPLPAAGPAGDGEVAPEGSTQGVTASSGVSPAGGTAAGPFAASGAPDGPPGAAPAASLPAGQRSAAVPVSPPAAARTAPTETVPELDLGNVMVPVLLRRFGPVVAACVVTAVVTWVVARRR